MNIPPAPAVAYRRSASFTLSFLRATITVFCAAGLCGLSALGLLFVADRRQLGRINEVAELMRTQRFKAALELLQPGVDSTTLDGGVAWLAGFLPRASASFLATSLIEGAEVARTLAAGQSAEAPDGVSPALAELFRQLASRSRAIQEMENDIVRRRKLARQAGADYLPIALRAARLFSLPAAPALEGHPLPIYQAGFLQGVPRLVGLDDGLSDIDQLESALLSARGKVVVTGADPAAAFREELSAIRSLTALLATDFVTNTAEVDRLVNEVKNSRRERAEYLRQFTLLASKELLEEPSLKVPAWESLYRWFRESNSN